MKYDSKLKKTTKLTIREHGIYTHNVLVYNSGENYS